MDKGEAHSKPGIGNLREDSPVFPLASGCDIDLHRKPRLHGSYAPGRTPSGRPPASAPPHGIIHTGPPPLISNLMPIKSAKVCAYHKKFLRGPRMPGRYPLERAELGPLSPNAHRVGKNDRRAPKKSCLGKILEDTSVSVRGRRPKRAGLPWIARRGRRVWRGDARGWLADRPLLRQTLGATFQPALAPACPARAGRESVPTWFQLTAWFP
jgi:hypothetical protein